MWCPLDVSKQVCQLYYNSPSVWGALQALASKNKDAAVYKNGSYISTLYNAGYGKFKFCYHGIPETSPTNTTKLAEN